MVAPRLMGKSSVLTTVMLGISTSRAFSMTSMVTASSWKYLVSSFGLSAFFSAFFSSFFLTWAGGAV